MGRSHSGFIVAIDHVEFDVDVGPQRRIAAIGRHDAKSEFVPLFRIGPFRLTLTFRDEDIDIPTPHTHTHTHTHWFSNTTRKLTQIYANLCKFYANLYVLIDRLLISKF